MYKYIVRMHPGDVQGNGALAVVLGSLPPITTPQLSPACWTSIEWYIAEITGSLHIAISSGSQAQNIEKKIIILGEEQLVTIRLVPNQPRSLERSRKCETLSMLRVEIMDKQEGERENTETHLVFCRLPLCAFFVPSLALTDYDTANLMLSLVKNPVFEGNDWGTVNGIKSREIDINQKYGTTVFFESGLTVVADFLFSVWKFAIAENRPFWVITWHNCLRAVVTRAKYIKEDLNRGGSIHGEDLRSKSIRAGVGGLRGAFVEDLQAETCFLWHQAAIQAKIVVSVYLFYRDEELAARAQVTHRQNRFTLCDPTLNTLNPVAKGLNGVQNWLDVCDNNVLTQLELQILVHTTEAKKKTRYGLVQLSGAKSEKISVWKNA
ncbi:hypothetical protein DFH07DRAFT_766698 [Mycena maculata]|uniref:Uncharacterized protein n=1 Tax=Mycena maculata TaxID=230809 RepID=A0AAD7K1S5_9AGAR|nr:hypothetical protein DFH07DRAFT_766698 [Mycena maculata]